MIAAHSALSEGAARNGGGADVEADRFFPEARNRFCFLGQVSRAKNGGDRG
jgi:hypothetical protein